MNSSVGLVIYIVFFFALMYFLIIRPQQKKTKELESLRSSLKYGDTVVTVGGIVGDIISLTDDEVILTVGESKTELTVKKWAISTTNSSVGTEASPEISE